MSKTKNTFICGYCRKEFKDSKKNRRFCSRECSGKSCIKDITGQIFGNLTAIKRLDESNISHKLWLCKCECGNFTKVPINFLTKGHTKSCGCLKRVKGKWMSENHPEYFQGTNISRIIQDKPFVNNTSGVRGVHLTKKGKWIARIGFQNKRIHLGLFNAFEEAVNARREAEEIYYKPIVEEYAAISALEMTKPLCDE